jgi:plasmid maintenance system antidote protein VapI
VEIDFFQDKDQSYQTTGLQRWSMFASQALNSFWYNNTVSTVYKNKQKNVNKFVYFCFMNTDINIIKGIHPGLFLERKIREQKLIKGKLALDCHEYPQTLTAITKGKRDMNTALSLKLEKALGLEEGCLMTLQIFYEIKEEKKKQSNDNPDLKQFRKILFWDTKMESLNWKKQYRFIINRIFERGNEEEKNAVKAYYGTALINEVLSKRKF